MTDDADMDLRFIHSDELRSILRRDMAELDACLKAGAHKAAVVLAGSVIEAILVDHFLAEPTAWTKQQPVLEVPMGTLLEVARAAGIMGDRALRLSEVVKDYRNLLHPGRELRTKEIPDADSAQVAKSLLNMVLRDVVAAHERTGGITATAAFAKMQQDPEGTSVIPYLVERMSAVEREKLLREIPAACHTEMWGGEESRDTRIAWMEAVHAALRKKVSSAVLTAEVAALDAILTSGDPGRINATLRFLRDDLDRAPKPLRVALLKYVIGQAQTADAGARDYWANHCGFDFVGRYIDADTEADLSNYLGRFRWLKAMSPSSERAMRGLCSGLDRAVAERLSVEVSKWSEGGNRDEVLAALSDYPF